VENPASYIIRPSPHCCILFDTGGDASILLRNMYRTEIDPRKIDNVVLSHRHGDHTGGLGGFLQFHHDVTVYIPKSFPRNFKKEVGLTGARVQEVGGPMMIHSGIYTTGELGGFIKEQSLVLKTPEGLVIITGCAHSGIVKIVEHAVDLFREKVYLLLGGFHLMGRSRENIRATIGRLDELKVERIAPCHCSEDRARELFRHHYGENYIDCGVGLVSEIPALQR
jgi:7,8-dihydropterin-6-yl-methyl-4-(beta-D-ribofuranosyl)aminobenzene 5'-phosphate synthase